jgi:hypothetical protein
MSRLNFAPLSDAFYLGSDQIKNTQEEINKLRQIISDTTLSKSPNNISKKEAKFIMSYLKELTPSGIELEFISISSF